MDLTETKTVVVTLHKNTWKRLYRLAIDEETSLALIINEALAMFLKWLIKIEQNDRIEAKKCNAKDLKEYQKEILETQRLIEKYRREKIAYKMKMLEKEKHQRNRKAYFRGNYKKKGMLA